MVSTPGLVRKLGLFCRFYMSSVSIVVENIWRDLFYNGFARFLVNCVLLVLFV